MRTRIQRTNDEIYAAWNAHDPDRVAAMYAEDAEILDVVSGAVTLGRASIRAVAAARLCGLAGFSLTRHALLIDGSRSSDRWTMRGSHTAEYDGLAATGNAIELEGASFSDYEAAGCVVREAHYVDVPALLRQLGVG